MVGERDAEGPVEHEVKGVGGWRRNDLYGAVYGMHFLKILVPMHEPHLSFASALKIAKSYLWNSEDLLPFPDEYGRYTIHK